MNVTVTNTAGLLAALKVASAGETISLASGTYSSVAISGFHVAGVTITSATPGAPATIQGLKVYNSSGLTFGNLDMTTIGSGDASYGFRVSGSSNIQFSSCSFHGSLDGNAKNDISGLLFENNTNVTVKGCQFQHLINAVTNLNNKNISISNNSFHDISGDGVDNGGASNVVISGNKFTNFTQSATGQHQDAIQFWTTNTSTAASNITISGNSITQGSGVAVQGIFMSDQVGALAYQNVTIGNNTVVGGLWNGIDVVHASGLTMSGNQLFALDDSIYTSRLMVSGADNANISGNIAAQYVLGFYGANTNIAESGDLSNTALSASTVFVQSSYSLGVGDHTVQATGSANVVITGNNLGNTIIGNQGTDTLIGGKGADVLSDGGGAQADTLIGGGGSDTFYVNNTHDLVQQSAGGQSAIITSVSFTVPANVQALTAVGSNGVTLVGNNLGDTITANSGADILTGGTGADVFVLAPGQKAETITNFNGANDHIDISAYLGIGQHYTITDIGSDAVVTFTDGDVIHLLGVQASTLHVSGSMIV